MRLAFLASHGGSAARALVEAIRAGELKAEAVALTSNNSKSPALAWAREAGLRAAHLSSAKYPDAGELDRAIRDFLVGSGADTLILSGYMKELGPQTLAAFEGRILNIHPSLLPRHPGLDTHARALAAGDAGDEVVTTTARDESLMELLPRAVHPGALLLDARLAPTCTRSHGTSLVPGDPGPDKAYGAAVEPDKRARVGGRG